MNNAINEARERLVSSISEAHKALTKRIETDSEIECQYAHNGVSISISPKLTPVTELLPFIALTSHLKQGISIAAQNRSDASYLLLDLIEAVESDAFDSLLMDATGAARAEIDYMSGYPKILGWHLFSTPPSLVA